MQDWTPQEDGQGWRDALVRAVFVLLIAGLAVILVAAVARAQGSEADSPAPAEAEAEEAAPDAPAEAVVEAAPETPAPEIPENAVTVTGILEPCLLPHGDPETYRATLRAVGWSDIATEQRPDALDRLTDVWLPVTGRIDGSWDDHLAHRADARAFWADFVGQRTLMERDGKVLLLAGFEDARGNLRVECWTAGPANPMTDSFFALLGYGYDADGIQMTQIIVPANDAFPETEYFILRLAPPPALTGRITGGDGIRTTITIPFPTTL